MFFKSIKDMIMLKRANKLKINEYCEVMYSESLAEEIKKIIMDNNLLDCTIDNFEKVWCWNIISRHRNLSEEFIEKFKDKVWWDYISEYQKLSEEFIEKFKKDVHWGLISEYQKLSESFIEKYQDKLSWSYISTYQKLSEPFIENFKHKVNWDYISEFQKLSEGFIEKFIDSVSWLCVSKSQNLSESFIEKFQDYVDWGNISKYQKLSPKFRKKYNIKTSEYNWLYKPVNFKLKYIKENTNYEIVDDKYIIAYKGIRRDNYSKFNFQYKYEVGKIYEAHCDCNIDNENSFGLSAWTLKKARSYCNEKILKVKIAISDIGCIVMNENKIRCFKFEVLEEI